MILTDDQGYGDLACLGNPHLKTPNIDALYAQSLRLAQYHHSPVCAPTRASLMTGRYNYRTCAIDTYKGRAMMHPDETTLAEMLGAAGYRTGIFGKWHLGDCFPMRAIDQGFQESLVIHGGGLKQPSDPPGSGGYFDPILMHNGELEQHRGYCTDIYADAAIRFMESHKSEPFFCYLPTNAPHTPLLVDDKYVAPYTAMGLPEPVAKVYGMIANLDENVGRVLQALERLGLTNDTIVLFMTDNGAQISGDAPRFNATQRGQKGTVYQGGIRVPCFVRWPGTLQSGRDIDRAAAHIDIAPTLLEACGVTAPSHVRFDGKSLWPLMAGAREPANWPDRSLFFQWHRGDVPEPYNNCAVRTQRYKLVNGLELYDLEADPAEEHDLAAQQPDVVARLRSEYEAWLQDVSSTRGYTPPRIVIGDSRSNPVHLTLQDQRGGEAPGGPNGGHWDIYAAREGAYSVTLRFSGEDIQNPPGPWQVHLNIGGVHLQQALPPSATDCTFSSVPLPSGPASLRAWTESQGNARSARFVDIQRI
jgi:arylsulfatase A-like enzyme